MLQFFTENIVSQPGTIAYLNIGSGFLTLVTVPSTEVRILLWSLSNTLL